MGRSHRAHRGRRRGTPWDSAARGITYARLRLLSVLRHGGPRRLLDLGGELGVTARNTTGLVDTLERDGWPNACPTQEPAALLVRLTPAGERLADELLTTQRAALAELLVELPEADQRHLLQALESLRGRAGTTPRTLARSPPAWAGTGSPAESSSRRHPSRPPSTQLARNIPFDLLCGATSYAPGRWASLLDTL